MKILTSFQQQYRQAVVQQQQQTSTSSLNTTTTTTSEQTYKTILWINDKYSMMDIFFDNLKQFSEQPMDDTEYENIRQNEVQVRLNFLTFVYSIQATPREFDLTIEQIDQLWQSIILNGKFKACTKDLLFHWLLNQTKNKEEHAITLNKFKYIFMYKINMLDPKCFTTLSLNLYQELFKIYKYSYNHSQNHQNEKRVHDKYKKIEANSIDYIGKLAIQSENNEVCNGCPFG
jgi:ubiquitin carboxyl-terminal hydrolase 34